MRGEVRKRMAFDQKRLGLLSSEQGISLTEQMLRQFSDYAGILQEWNQKMNLTAIVDDEGILVKHFLDSLLLLDALKAVGMDTGGMKMIDVGTGAGFPGVPTAIACPGTRLTLLDGLNKRIVFLRHLCENLGIEAEAIHARAEEAGRKAEYREQYDLASARAVSDLRELSEYCLPFVKQGGYFAALKGYDVEQEVKGASKAIGLLGGKVEQIRKYVLPDGSKRSIVCIKKISQTPSKYPRPSAKIAKSPLI